MVRLNNVVNFLNKELKVRTIKDPWSINGLQVRSSDSVRKVGLSVDACMDVFEKAKKSGCDLVIVHHGLLQPNEKDVSNLTKDRIRYLKKNRISLYAAHLPLDKHARHGNNAVITRLMGNEPKNIFGQLGYVSYLKGYRNVDSVAKELEKKLDTKCKVWKFGKKKVKRIVVFSGYGGSEIPEAIKKGIDLYITGELSHGSYLKAKEGKLNVIIAGHYNSEKVGVKSVGTLLEKTFDLKTIFIDNPTGL